MFITSVIMSLIQGVNPYISILLSAYVLDGLTAGEDFRQLLLVVVLGVGLIFILTVTNAYVSKIRDVHIEICVHNFNMKMSERTLTMDYELLESPVVNNIRTRIRMDNNWGAGFYSMIWQLPEVLINIISIIISIIILFPLFTSDSLFFDISAVLIFLVFCSIIIFNSLYTSINTKKIHSLLGDPKINKNYYVHFLWGAKDYRSGKDIRLFNAKKLIQTYLEGDERIKTDWTKKMIQNNSSIGFVNGMSTGLLQAGAYLYVVFRAVTGALTVGLVLKYASTIFRFSNSLSDLFRAITDYSLSAKRQQSTLEYMNIPDKLYKGNLPIKNQNNNQYEIEFHNVSFKYPGSSMYALKDLNLRLNVGQRMAIVGMNGSGKTTMIKLLCRLYDPTEGVITLNGIDIKKYNYTEYMSLFSVVFQDFKLFSFSLGQNVAANMDYDRGKAIEALDKAGLSNRLLTMPKGLDTPLYKDFEEDGVEISGGEAQKIALARALYKDAPFIILDEPTAALDPIAEYEIYSNFNRIIGDKTAIYISHRLSSCRFCDDIIVFHEGKAIQRGNHNTLIADTKGKYYELWNAQAQYYMESKKVL